MFLKHAEYVYIHTLTLIPIMQRQFQSLEQEARGGKYPIFPPIMERLPDDGPEVNVRVSLVFGLNTVRFNPSVGVSSANNASW